MKDDVLRSGDEDWAKITICAFASRERDFGDLGRGILCSQGFGKPPLFVGLVTKMADESNGDRFPLSVGIPVAFRTVDVNQTTVKPDVNQTTVKPDVNQTTVKPDVNQTTVKPDVYQTTVKPDVYQTKLSRRFMAGVDAKQGTFPYAVSIWPTGVLHFCNGALISSKHVLTVASCVEKAYRFPSKVISKIGDIHIRDEYRGSDAESLTASKITMSPRQGRKKGKLAIIVLETESKKDPLLLPEAGQLKNLRMMQSYIRSCRCRLLQGWTQRIRLWLGADNSWQRVFRDPPARNGHLLQSRYLH